MKLTETVIELMFELSNIEGVKHFEGDATLLRNSLLKLFKTTDNPDAHEIIIDIISEAGYPWFANIAQPKNNDRLVHDTSEVVSELVVRPRVMSDSEFLDLLPANGRIP